ncbi:phosphotransferase family protein [Halalkalibacter akibai]|uniref:Aminoglycoside phosphotransferase domain-containing protein n=1 Tax=Halalkalibacter akibai (strain ATCC 43226 / DSM 21942 / CIP 109018 / JCM 9157 / 1139) TaxID=1236973 RepID=W4QZU2_HALA3|nr:aminoglycoside phosphotransferase family protein [Halalkalibacter akibai]GAE37601.1 hypothetical protein JCM9157_4916 [Halalkalibacter akibai JCM 9157]
MQSEFQLVNWQNKNEFFNELLYNERLEIKFLSEGQEAEIFVLIIESEHKCIIKRWRKGFRINVKNQFDFLEKGLLNGLPVPFPYSWGIDKNDVQYLVMSYAGSPLKTPSDNQIKSLTSVLYSIHRSALILNEEKMNLSSFDELINDYFPRLNTQSDIANLIQQLKKEIPIRKPTLIHGDFNLGNVLFNDNNITVIDWTNTRIGDFRYDFAWAYFLLWLYNGEKPSRLFADTYKYLLNHTVMPFEFELFECIAALRWVLLNRLFSLPQGIEKQEQVKRFIKERIPERLRGDFDVY